MSGHEERPHRDYSPSKAERIALCPGSVRQVKRVAARPPTPYSIEGQKAHVVVQAALENKVRKAREAHKDYSFLCMEELDVQYGGTYKDFYFSVQMMLDHVYGILDANPGAVLFTETYVDPPSEAAPGEAAGWCDVAIYVPPRRWLYVIDYKHGAGVTKAVVGNRQVLQYAAGFLYDTRSPLEDIMVATDEGTPVFNEDGVEEYGPEVDGLTLVICQPRAYHPDGEIREYDVTPYQVYEYLSDMDDKIRAAQAENAPLIPGPEQCQFCDAAPTCPAREAKALAAVNVQFATVRDIKAPGIPDPLQMEVDQLEYAMLQLPTLRSWADSVEKRLFELAAQGTPLRHHKLVEAQARRRWYGDPEHLATELSKITGKSPDELIVKKLINITDADKLAVQHYKAMAPTGKKKEAAEDAKKAMAFLTLKDTSGNLTLVTNDDPRSPADRAKVAFAQVGPLLPGTTTVIGDDE